MEILGTPWARDTTFGNAREVVAKRPLAAAEVELKVDAEAEIKARKAAKAAEAERRLLAKWPVAAAEVELKKVDAEAESKAKKAAEAQKKAAELTQSKLQSKLLQAERAAQVTRAAAESSALTQDLIAFLEVACIIGLSRDVITDYCEEWCSKGERMAEHHLADEARINRKAHDEDLEAGRALRARGPWTEERCEAGAEPAAEAC